MSSIKTQALVLSSIKWKDSSRIVTLFTSLQGRIKVIAHGAAREKSRFRGKLETLNLLECLIAYRKSRSLQVLTDVLLINDFRHIKSDYSKMAFGFAILEILDNVFQEVEIDDVFFQFILTIMNNLEKTKKQKLIWWYFLLKLASYLGFKPDLEQCAICEKKPSTEATFAMQKGIIYCQNCATEDGLISKLPLTNYLFLNQLQKENYKNIGIREDGREIPSYDYTNLLLNYLNLHLGHELRLKSLSLVQEN
jgi:DNA repair protein RecO (recombination protein O)